MLKNIIIIAWPVSTNGSKTVVMDIIGFLYVSLGSRCVCVHVQRFVSVVKMVTTVLEEYISEEQHSLTCLLLAKGLNANYIHKEMLPIYGGKCLSHKEFTAGYLKTTLVANILLMTKRLKQRYGNGRVKTRLLCYEFWHTGKAMGHVYQCWQRICWEINVFFLFKYYKFYNFISICDLFIDSPLYVNILKLWFKIF
jgi:hypothetical protein